MIKKFRKNDFLTGLFWNYGSIAFLALGGFAFSFLIILFYDSEILGIFNLTYAYYLVFSQISAFGIHMSVTRYISEYSENLEKCKVIFFSAAIMSFAISTTFCMTIYVFLSKWGFIIREELKESLQAVLPALIFFSQNKVILGYLNGLSRMKVYAIFQALRNIFISVSILFLALCKTKGVLISRCFLLAESVLFIISVVYLLIQRLLLPKLAKEWLNKHINFGIRILPANLVLELNTKIDVICLGMMLKNDSLVGVYSFATMFTEGFYQIFVVVRRSINPKITQFFSRNREDNKFMTLKKKIERYLKIFGVPLLIALIGGFSIICFLMGKDEYYQGIMPLCIISMSIILNSKGIVFGNMLSQLGYPTEESLINCFTAMSNFILNFIFIKYWALLGAASATAVSYCVYTVMLKYFVKKELKIKL